ncbi:MAG: type II secretion system F family protein [Vicinamibacterales bacterium]
MGALFVPVAVFLLATGAVVGLYAAVTYLPGFLARERIDQRIREAAGTPFAQSGSGDSVLKAQIEGPLPLVDRIMAQSGQGSAMAKLIEQAGFRMSVSSLLLMSMGCGAVGGLGLATMRVPYGLFVGAALGCVTPFLYLRHRRKKRLRSFEEQFPEALDMLSRALRAGHAFTTAMSMVADEAPDPIGPEFRKSFDEQNFGLPLKDALNNLSERVPLLDVRFFVTAVLIQRETGGNLSEILDNLAHVVRERFKILRQVRVYTAHGRLTGYTLLALPAVLAVLLTMLNPDLMNLLFEEQMGRMMLTGAIVLQVIGFFWIKHVVKIEV